MSSMVWDAWEAGITTSLGGEYVGDSSYIRSYEDDDYEDDDYEDDEEKYEDIEIEVGDIVKLNSSDLPMTVKSKNDSTLICRWFDKNNILQSEEFDVLELTLVDKVKNHQNPLDTSIKMPVIDIDDDEIPF